MSAWSKVSGNNVIASKKAGEGIILVADETLAWRGFFITMKLSAVGHGLWLFHCRKSDETVNQYVSYDELVEVWFENTRIRANPSKGWVHLLRR